MTERWFISYKYRKTQFLDGLCEDEGFGVVITDISPARWTLYARIGLNRDHYVLYAEEISMALAVEMVHGGAGVPTAFFMEEDPDETIDF
ncbi:MAG: hypothetical protein GY820_16940 [Gammaproteobacteria bacterium]|nr:hypothetical protein [Gammaproteobacteria bacterium]